jgi:hypothetical protein
LQLTGQIQDQNDKNVQGAVTTNRVFFSLPCSVPAHAIGLLTKIELLRRHLLRLAVAQVKTPFDYV